ncbi:MAG: hypothetical protein ACTHLH_00220 [Solirubrobacterales bacterium]
MDTDQLVEIARGRCYWCQERDADSREHMFKRSDLIREHGRGELRAGRTLVAYRGEKTSEHRSTKNDAFKFSASLCSYCNNARSQPFDRAYDCFIEWIFENEEKVIADRYIDLEEALGFEWLEVSNNVLRYFVKHICCRLAETVHSEGGTLLPKDALAFLDGGPPPRNISTEMWIEPTWLRFAQAGANDPDWVRPMGMEPVHPGPEMRLGSRWRYGWLVLGWECWGEEDGNVLLDKDLKLPIVSTHSTGMELAFMPTMAEPSDEEPVDVAWLERVTGGAVIDLEPLSSSPVAQKFIGGALDFEAGLRNQAPDRRELVLTDSPPPYEVEVMRTGWLCGIARHVWANGSVDAVVVRSIGLDDVLLDPQMLFEEAERLGAIAPEKGWAAVTGGFAAMASLKLVEAHEYGVDTDEGYEAMLSAASLAGASAASAGAWSEDWQQTCDSIRAAVALIAPLAAAVEENFKAVKPT